MSGNASGNLLDSLFMELGLDPSKFEKGSKDVRAAFKKLKEALQEDGKEIEKTGNKAATSIAGLARETLGLLSIVGGSFTAAKFLEFSKNLANVDAVSSRTAANLGMSAQDLQAWGLALQRMGGNAQSATGFLQDLQNKLWEYHKLGKPLPLPFYFAQNFRTDTQEHMLEDLSRSFRGEARSQGRAEAAAHWRQIGGPEDLFNLIISLDFNKRLTEAKKLVARREDIEAATKLQDAWAKLTQTMTNLGRIIATDINAPLTRFLDLLTRLAGLLTSRFASKPLAGQHQDLNQSFADALKNGPRYTSRPQIPDPNQGWWGRSFWPRYIDDPNALASPAPASGPAPATGASEQSGGTAASGGAGLAAQRERFRAELAANPALRERALAISLGENQNSNANRAVFETAMNRAAMMGTSLSQEMRTTGMGGYYAGYNPRALRNPRLRAMAEANLEAALGGSNVSNYATDNASQAWGWRRMHGMYSMDFTAGGEYFGHPVRSDARGWNRWQAWKNRAAQARSSNGWSSPYVSSDFSGYGMNAGAGYIATLQNPRPSSNVSNSEMNIHGPISVFTQALSADELARDLRPALERSVYSFQANDGAH